MPFLVSTYQSTICTCAEIEHVKLELQQIKMPFLVSTYQSTICTCAEIEHVKLELQQNAIFSIHISVYYLYMRRN